MQSHPPLVAESKALLSFSDGPLSTVTSVCLECKHAAKAMGCHYLLDVKLSHQKKEEGLQNVNLVVMGRLSPACTSDETAVHDPKNLLFDLC